MTTIEQVPENAVPAVVMNGGFHLVNDRDGSYAVGYVTLNGWTYYQIVEYDPSVDEWIAQPSVDRWYRKRFDA